LTAPEEILVELDVEEFTVGFRWLLAVDEEPWTLTDYCFSWMRSLARHGSGTTLNPLRVEYVQQPNVRHVECSLGCEVVVGAPRNVVVFRASDATKPFVTRNAELLDLLAPQFEEQLRQYKEEDSFETCAPHDPRQTDRPPALDRRNIESSTYGTAYFTTEASGLWIKLSTRLG
jgi:hypothetical protein